LPVNGALLGVLLARLWELAADIGRLRRRCEPGSSLEHVADRIANHIAVIDTMLRPTAAELVAWNTPGDEEAIDEALRQVDLHAQQLAGRLGGRL
jgi:hypothetical protein